MVTTDITSLDSMSWEELMHLREVFLAEQEDIEAAISVIKEEIVERLTKENVNGKVVGNKSISVTTSYTTDKDTAKELGAIKVITQERIDTTMIKELVSKGVQVPNLQVIKSPTIRDVVKKDKHVDNS